MRTLSNPTRLDQGFISDLIFAQCFSGLLNILMQFQSFLNWSVLISIHQGFVIQRIDYSVVVILHIDIFVRLATSRLSHFQNIKKASQIIMNYKLSLQYFNVHNNQLIDMFQPFGFNQTALQNQQWLQIGTEMLKSPYTRLKNIQMLAEAEHQSRRFANMGNLVGGVLFLAFLKFPLVRIQPGFRRVGASAVLAYPFYWYMHNLATKLQVKRIKFAFHKQQVQHKGNKRVTV